MMTFKIYQIREIYKKWEQHWQEVVEQAPSFC